MDFKAPRLGDAGIALALFVLAATNLVALESYDISLGRSPDLVGYLLLAAMTLPIAWRQRSPRLVLWVVFLAWSVFVGLSYADGTGIFGVIVALYGVGLYLTRKQALIHGGAIVAIAVVWTTVGALVTDEVHLLSVVSVAIAFVVPFEIGLLDNRRHARLTELEVAHSRQQHAHEAAAMDAVRAERARIARELHDVVAHEVTVMTLQAEGARRRAKNADPAVTEALATISESGRRGLLEMQRMIGVLRATEADATDKAATDKAIATGGSVPASPVTFVDDLSPMPSLAALPALVKKVEDSGLPVHLQITGSAHVPAGVELSAYRIVQESLTNAMKHAGPGASADVSVKRRKGEVTVTVVDDGRGVISEAAQASGGHGIAGMRERVAALGGTLDCGARNGGGYRVHAVLPSTDDQVTSSRKREPLTAIAVGIIDKEHPE